MKLHYLGRGITHEVYDHDTNTSYIRIKAVWYIYNKKGDTLSACSQYVDSMLEQYIDGFDRKPSWTA